MSCITCAALKKDIAMFVLKLARAQEVCNRDAERLVKLHDDNVDLRNEIAALKGMK